MTPEAQVEADAALANRIHAGDTAAEHEFVQRFSQPLRVIVRKRVGDEELAQDLLQETLAASIKRLREAPLDDPLKLANYIHRIAVNKCRSANRLIKRRATDAASDIIDDVPASAPGPYSLTLRDTSRMAVRRLLDELRTPRDREILTRFFILEETKSNICNALELEPRHFDRVLYRAKQRFRTLIETHAPLLGGTTVDQAADDS